MRNNLKVYMPVGLALLAIAPLYAGDRNATPDSEPLSRYQAMIDHSPFALASEVAPPPAPENVGFTKDLVLTGAVRLNGGEYITVESKDHNQRFSLKTGEMYNEILLVSVAWSDATGKTRVTLKKGTEFGTIGFDEAALKAAAVPQPEAQGGAPKGQSSQPSGMAGKTPPPQNGSGQNPAIIRRVRPIPAASPQ